MSVELFFICAPHERDFGSGGRTGNQHVPRACLQPALRYLGCVGPACAFHHDIHTAKVQLREIRFCGKRDHMTVDRKALIAL